jgi:hypothetical protein
MLLEFHYVQWEGGFNMVYECLSESVYELDSDMKFQCLIIYPLVSIFMLFTFYD